MAKDTTPVETTETVVDETLEVVTIAPVVETAPLPTVECDKTCNTSGYCQNCGKIAE